MREFEHKRLRGAPLLLVLVGLMSIGLWSSRLITPAQAQSPKAQLPPNFTLDVLADKIHQPIAFSFLPDGRVLLGEKDGAIRIFDLATKQSKLVIDLSPEVNGAAERGLMDITIDPNFAQNGYFYALYTYDTANEIASQPKDQLEDAVQLRAGRLTRYTLMNDAASRDSAFNLIDGYQSDLPYHAPGAMRFAKDGTLFVTFGDSSDPYTPNDLSLRAQALDLLHGKMIHINADGSAVTSNPFYDPQRPDSVRSKIWATGLRNPFRFALHPETQIPYVGNVGWSKFESILRVTAGANFGWPCYESNNDLPEFQVRYVCEDVTKDKVARTAYDYTHNGGAAAVIAGDFNPGGNFPAAMRGNFFFADFSGRYLQRAQLDAEGNITQVEKFVPDIGYLVDMHFGPDGALYALEYFSGQILKLAYTGTDAVAAAAASTPVVAPTVVLTPTGPSTTSMPSTPMAAVTSTITTTTTATISNPAPAATQAPPSMAVLINSPERDRTFAAGQVVTVTGQAVGAGGKAVPAGQLTWDVTWVSGLSRRTLARGSGATISFVMPAAEPAGVPTQMSEGGYVAVTLRAESNGAQASTRIDLHPQPADGYIRAWWLVGGFFNHTLNEDMLPGGEANFTLPNDSLDRALPVKRVYSVSRRVDLASYIQPPEHNIVYAFTWVYVPTARQGLLGLNSDDGIAVWVNGQEVWRNAVSRYVPFDTRDIDLPGISLKQGWNAVLVKVEQNVGDWVFKARVLNPNGAVMRDAVAATTPDTQ